jgi:membrane protein implicated in regulation of membrane protease activity
MLEPTYWHWWILAGTLLMLELFFMGTFFLWLAAAAAFVGVLLVIIHVPFQIQVLLFALGAIASLLLTRIYLSKLPVRSDQPQLNVRGSEHIGRVFVVQEAINNGLGRIEAGDGSWRVEGPDCPIGTQVRVIGVEGARLKIEPLNPADS